MASKSYLSLPMAIHFYDSHDALDFAVPEELAKNEDMGAVADLHDSYLEILTVVRTRRFEVFGRRFDECVPLCAETRVERALYSSWLREIGHEGGHDSCVYLTGISNSVYVAYGVALCMVGEDVPPDFLYAVRLLLDSGYGREERWGDRLRIEQYYRLLAPTPIPPRA